MSRAVSVLSLLDAYQQQHQEAGSHWKDCLWNLTKARHSKGGFLPHEGVLVAASVRHDLRPRAVLTTTLPVVPLLAEEGTVRAAAPSLENVVFFVVDPIAERAKLIETITRAKEDDTTEPLDVSAAAGLRQRKKSKSSKAESPKTTTAWTVQEEVYADNDDEETRLRKVDPLELFGGGLNPKVLQEAQKKAQLTLETYVRAANLKRALERLLEQASNGDGK